MSRPVTLVSPVAGSALAPLDARGVRIAGGFWGDRVGRNREASLLHGAAQLEASGALGNLRRAADADGEPVGGYRGGLDDAGVTFPFLDSDVYKWLEAVGWELGRAPEPRLLAAAEPVIASIERAQRPDGYLGTYVQLTGRPPFSDLEWGHELYCIGHLAQAAIAWDRSLGDDRLLRVVRRAIDRIEREVGPGGRNGIDGHPEIEMALVELYRHTGEARFLALARHQVEQRGRGYLGPGRFGPAYWQDVLPVREAPTVSGHAVRQVYLDCGVVDVAVETGDRALLDAAIARWREMVARRTYLTGAIGSRHMGEAFGDAWELPPDRAYAETCAAIGSVMLAWRLLLATGDPVYADHLERTLYNAVLPGLALDGTGFFYCDPLLVRSGGTGYGGREIRGREPWYACACCPPNLMRTLASFEHLLATRDGAGLTIWQPAEATIEAPAGSGTARLAVHTAYPADGTIRIAVESAPGGTWPLGIRIPAWAAGATASVGGATHAATPGTVLRIDRAWQAGDVLEVVLPMAPRVTVPDPRIDAIRGCAAIERGPLVLCLEAADLPAGATIETVVLEPGAVPADDAAPAPGGLPAVRIAGRVLQPVDGSWPYGTTIGDPAASPASLRAIPYLAWANRGPGGMRVWVPLG